MLQHKLFQDSFGPKYPIPTVVMVMKSYMYKYIHVIYRITGNVCVAKFLSFKFLHDLIFEQTEHAQYKMHVL